jgi:hypothetical protein
VSVKLRNPDRTRDKAPILKGAEDHVDGSRGVSFTRTNRRMGDEVRSGLVKKGRRMKKVGRLISGLSTNRRLLRVRSDNLFYLKRKSKLVQLSFRRFVVIKSNNLRFDTECHFRYFITFGEAGNRYLHQFRLLSQDSRKIPPREKERTRVRDDPFSGGEFGSSRDRREAACGGRFGSKSARRGESERVQESVSLRHGECYTETRGQVHIEERVRYSLTSRSPAAN